MICSFSDIRSKEIVSAKDGIKIGHVDDVEIDTQTSELTALISYGKYRLFGLLGKYSDMRIRWDQIKLIGEDIIIIDDYAVSNSYYGKKDSFMSRWFG